MSMNSENSSLRLDLSPRGRNVLARYDLNFKIARLGRSSASFTLTETEQALRVEVRDLLLVIGVDGHLIKELPSSFHAAVRIVGGEEDTVDTDRVRHAQIGLVRQTPALIHRARLLVYVFTSEDPTIKVFPKVFLDGAFQPTILFQRK
jgi:hypothetical protein